MDFELGPEEHAAEALGRDLAGAGDADATVEGIVSAAAAAGILADRSLVKAALTVAAMAETAPVRADVTAAAWLFVDALSRHGSSSGVDEARGGAARGTVVLSAPQDGAERLVVVHATRETLLSGSALAVPLATAAEFALVLAEVVESAPPGHGGTPVLALARVTPGGVRALAAGPGLAGTPCGDVMWSSAPVLAVLAAGDRARAAARELEATRALLDAALAAGISAGALERVKALVASAPRRPRQASEFAVSDIATLAEAARLSVLHAAWLRDHGEANATESAAAKLFATRSATRAVHAALGFAPPGDAALGGAYLDARLLEQRGGGPVEQENLIASGMLGESA